jgi:UDP-N-acetylmuramoylalanine--D-glutamate ligase
VATLVFGLGVAGASVARALRQQGETVFVGDDHLNDEHRQFATSIGATVVESSLDEPLRVALQQCTRLVPAPGIAEHHRLLAIAREVEAEIVSEIELAYQWEQTRVMGPRPMLGITGTDGKTTTTLMAAAMLQQAGHRVEAAGNTELPLVAALTGTADAFVVECSSFRLAYTQRFRCIASAWLNIAPDHLDWHVDFDSYMQAKAKIWENLRSGDVAVAPVTDSRIVRYAASSAGRVVSFGVDAGDYHAQNGVLTSPHGVILAMSDMARCLPHDVTNALAAAAICIESGLASVEEVGQALREFAHAPHRIELIGEHDDIRWYDDSKATSPHAALVAIRAFSSVVLIAGGRNKDLDLSSMASEPERMRAVVAIGESAGAISEVFTGKCPTAVARSMVEAVSIAAGFAKSGDVVLLSPGCTSFDWYNNYVERGNDFQKCVDLFRKNAKPEKGK